MSRPVSRRAFVNSAGAVGLASFIPIMPAMAFEGGHLGPDPDLMLDPDEGEVYFIGPSGRSRLTIKVDKRDKGVEALSLLTEDIVPGEGIPIHKHAAEEELIYIAHGHGVFTFGDDEHEVVSGSMAFVPRGVWHGLRNEGEEELRMVFAYAPAGFEDFFRAIGTRPGEPRKQFQEGEGVRIAERYGMTYRDYR